MRGILAHEVCHYRRRDNFTAAIHILAEALFWFYPPIWWLGARLINEREFACDESVLAAGNDAELYADSILKVCQFFRHSAMLGAAGVAGGALSRRIEQIMNCRGSSPVGRIKKLFVTVSIAAALCGMLWLTLPAAAAPPRLLAHVQLAAMPPAASPAASSVRQTPAQAQTKQTSAKPAQLTMIDPVRPLGKMQPAPQQLSAAFAASAPSAAALRAASDLTTAAAGMAVQLWLQEVKAQLKSHVEYPSDAIQKMQREGVMQDTVTLRFSVDRAGRVISSRAESEHHYQDLEQETRRMLQLTSALPAPPSLVSSPNTVVTVPVQFQLDFSPLLCSGSNCSTAQAFNTENLSNANATS